MSKTIISSSRSTSTTSNTINLETKIDNLIPKEDITLKWVKNILVNTISIENANTICDYVIAMRSEANISLSTIRNLIYTLTRFIRKFEDRSFRDINDLDIKLYLNSLRKPEDEDPTQRWIGSQNYIVSTLQKFYRWLYYPNVRTEQRALPDCVSGFRKIRRKEMARYAPSDLWSLEEHKTFLKYCPSTKIKAYHAMALDTSARPHELLKLKIKDLKERIIPATKDRPNECVIFQFLVKGKTGTRGLALTDSMAYVKQWLEQHPQKQNKEAFLFANRFGRLTHASVIYKKYTYYYKKDYFPRLLNDPNVPYSDKEIIRKMIEERKWNPYVIRHSALTMKARNRLMSDHMLRQHAGWAKNSNMPSVYLHEFGSESIDELLKMQGYLPREDGQFDFNPFGIKKCGNCGTQNLPEAISCARCKLLIDSVAYHEIMKEQQEKDKEIEIMKSSHEKQMKDLREEMQNKFQQILTKIDTGKLIIK